MITLQRKDIEHSLVRILFSAKECAQITIFTSKNLQYSFNLLQKEYFSHSKFTTAFPSLYSINRKSGRMYYLPLMRHTFSQKDAYEVPR